MIGNDNITNFLNSLAYHTDFDGVNLEDITLESCEYDLQEMKKQADPDDIELLDSITPAMLHNEYISLWHKQHKRQEKPNTDELMTVSIDSIIQAAQSIIDAVSVNHSILDNENYYQFAASIRFAVNHALFICHDENRDTQYDKLLTVNAILIDILK